MLFNNDVTLWENYRKCTDASMTNGGASLGVTADGSVENGMEILARCANRQAATKMLRAAGYRQVGQRFKAR